MTSRACWVIPCYNEASRLDSLAFQSLIDDSQDVDLLYVDDGSSDGTSEKLREMADSRPGRIRFLTLPSNQGKAEAVRQGLLEALRSDAVIVGYLDADLATPLSEMRRLTEIMVRRDVDLVFGSRVAMLGRNIERRSSRHYLGRIFASGASLALGVRIYDTQCGAKLFRRTPPLVVALSEPFNSRWAFDIELLGRLVIAPGGIERNRIIEEPLLEWRDMPGSNLRLAHMVRAAGDLCRIAWSLRGSRASRGRPPSKNSAS